MDATVQKRIQEWTTPPFDAATIAEVKALVDAKDEKELTERFYAMLEFGTGGLRGVLGAGTNRMNAHTVGMAAQGLADYIAAQGQQKMGVVIARDSRRMSDEFSRVAAEIMAGNGIVAYVFDDIAPTPLCSFAIRELKAVSGIVITASHNPPEYNGFKAYWDDGGQVVPPHDTAIIACVRKIESITQIKKLSWDEGIAKGLINIIGQDIIGAYIASLEKAALRPRAASELKIAYSPLHGTGYRIMPQVLAHFGFANVTLESAQAKPDGNFPTVKYPNPEEREAMQLLIELAKKTNADILVATDPDADRMGVGFRDERGEYLLINGNQIGTMLEYYLLKRLSAEGRLPKNGAVVKTIVTTDLQEEIAAHFGCVADNVLTGFKWIALKMKEYEDAGSRTFIFGGEESYGYLPVPFVRDKDAIAACYFFAEMADWLKGQGITLNDFLNEIYATFGLYLEGLHSLTLKGIEGIERIKGMMASLRALPPAEFAGVKVTRVDDIQNLVRTDCATGGTTAIADLPKSDVLQFFLADGTKITMRPSGTEPKIKFYFSVKEKTDAKGLAAAKIKLAERIDVLTKDLLKKVEA